MTNKTAFCDRLVKLLIALEDRMAISEDLMNQVNAHCDTCRDEDCGCWEEAFRAKVDFDQVVFKANWIYTQIL